MVENTSFFNEWNIAQKIINPFVHHAMITGEILDATTQQPLQMVKVVATDGTHTYEDMTDSKGKYKIPVNPEVWSLTYELGSYQKQEKTHIIVDSGEQQKINIKLTQDLVS